MSTDDVVEFRLREFRDECGLKPFAPDLLEVMGPICKDGIGFCNEAEGFFDLLTMDRSVRLKRSSLNCCCFLNNGLSSEAELDSSTSDSEFSSELPISD
jgi:hypothetical protein